MAFGRPDPDKFYTDHFPIAGTDDHMELVIRYNEGGMNYFNYKTERRGLYLHMSPVQIEEHKGYKTVSRMLMDDSSRKTLLLEMPRRNKSKGQKVAEQLRPHAEKIARLATKRDWQGVMDMLKEKGITA